MNQMTNITPMQAREMAFARLKALDPDWTPPAERQCLTLSGGLLTIGLALASLVR